MNVPADSAVQKPAAAEGPPSGLLAGCPSDGVRGGEPAHGFGPLGHGGRNGVSSVGQASADSGPTAEGYTRLATQPPHAPFGAWRGALAPRRQAAQGDAERGHAAGRMAGCGPLLRRGPWYTAANIAGEIHPPPGKRQHFQMGGTPDPNPPTNPPTQRVQ